MSAAGRGLLALLAVAVGLTTWTGCAVVDTPDESAWRDQARQSVEDASSEVQAARLVLVQLTADRVPQAYGVVMLADAEEAAGKVEESLAAVQAPAPVRRLSDDVTALLGRAVDAVRAARVAAVGDTEPAPIVRTDLADVQRQLDAMLGQL
ncbi:hypothetical protein ACFQ0K_08705 [Nocardioides caeni]|uniref:Lipoprotein n=1 Tax=Nocardioides caeni TaxID=574700 RepID=A0A4V4HJG3_9ACTN|nr:hypothetical protein [Nocardioides caeni]THV10476.1 hypothetical protein E9934_14200 [Nocardioides caeni]